MFQAKSYNNLCISKPLRLLKDSSLSFFVALQIVQTLCKSYEMRHESLFKSNFMSELIFSWKLLWFWLVIYTCMSESADMCHTSNVLTSVFCSLSLLLFLFFFFLCHAFLIGQFCLVTSSSFLSTPFSMPLLEALTIGVNAYR